MKTFLAAAVFFLAAVLWAGPFAWRAKIQENRLLVTAEIAPGHYFYRSTLVFDVRDASGKVIPPAVFPKGEIIADDMFGPVEIYPAGTRTWIFQNDGPFVKASVNFKRLQAGGALGTSLNLVKEYQCLPGSENQRRVD